jgi:predicted TIM-barrel fold metal-dependent hydrolase
MSAPPLEIVDPHQHFWDLGRNYYPWLSDRPIVFRYGDYGALKRNYLPADYLADAAPIRVLKTVHVEAEWDRADPVGETRWLEALAARSGLPTAIVAHARLDAEDAEAVLAAQAASPLLRGIRHKPSAAPSPGEARRGAPGSMDDPRWRRGFAALARLGLAFDLQTPWWHLAAARELARDFPATTIVLDHTGLPVDRSPEGLAGWRRGLETLADCPNAVLKISGLGRAGQPWTVEANGPIIRDAIAIFGAGRAMFASNFPVDKLAGSFADIYGGFQAVVAARAEAERRMLFRENAERVYRL